MSEIRNPTGPLNLSDILYPWRTNSGGVGPQGPAGPQGAAGSSSPPLTDGTTANFTLGTNDWVLRQDGGATLMVSHLNWQVGEQLIVLHSGAARKGSTTVSFELWPQFSIDGFSTFQDLSGHGYGSGATVASSGDITTVYTPNTTDTPALANGATLSIRLGMIGWTQDAVVTRSDGQSITLVSQRYPAGTILTPQGYVWDATP